MASPHLRNNSNRDLKSLTPDELCELLRATHFGSDILELFENNALNGTELENMHDASLKSLGVKLALQRRDILHLKASWGRNGVSTRLLRSPHPPRSTADRIEKAESSLLEKCKAELHGLSWRRPTSGFKADICVNFSPQRTLCSTNPPQSTTNAQLKTIGLKSLVVQHAETDAKPGLFDPSSTLPAQAQDFLVAYALPTTTESLLLTPCPSVDEAVQEYCGWQFLDEKDPHMGLSGATNGPPDERMIDLEVDWELVDQDHREFSDGTGGGDEYF